MGAAEEEEEGSKICRMDRRPEYRDNAIVVKETGSGTDLMEKVGIYVENLQSVTDGRTDTPAYEDSTANLKLSSHLSPMSMVLQKF